MKKALVVVLSAIMVLTMSVVLTGCGGSSSSGGSASGNSGSKVTIHFGATTATNHAWYKDAKKFKETVEKDSDGSISVALEFGGVNGSDKDYAEGVQNGTIDMYIGSTVGFDTMVPKIDYVNLPYFIDSYETADKLIYGEDGTGTGWVGENIKKNAEEAGYHWLGITDCDFRWISNSKRPIKSAADMKGMKLRVPEAPMFLEFFKNLGATPTAMGITEVASALQQKTIDGQDNGPILSYYGFGFSQFNKYFTKTNHSFAPAVVVMSTKCWDSLSEDQQKIVQDAATTYCEQVKTDLRKDVKTAEKEMTEKDGCKVIEATPQLKKDMQKAAYKVWQDKKVTKTFDQDAVAKMLKDANLD